MKYINVKKCLDFFLVKYEQVWIEKSLKMEV
jgi:hypothetical protein